MKRVHDWLISIQPFIHIGWFWDIIDFFNHFFWSLYFSDSLLAAVSLLSVSCTDRANAIKKKQKRDLFDLKIWNLKAVVSLFRRTETLAVRFKHFIMSYWVQKLATNKYLASFTNMFLCDTCLLYSAVLHVTIKKKRLFLSNLKIHD